MEHYVKQWKKLKQLTQWLTDNKITRQEDELSEADKKYMEFGRLFEQHFLNQGFDTNRSIEETLDLGWLLLSVLPKNTLDRIDNAVVDKFYDHEKAVKEFNLHEDVVIKELKDAVTNG